MTVIEQLKTTSGWFNGLIGAAINSSVNTFLAGYIDPEHFNPFVSHQFKHFLALLGVSAVAGAALFLKQHPTPWPQRKDSIGM